MTWGLVTFWICFDYLRHAVTDYELSGEQKALLSPTEREAFELQDRFMAAPGDFDDQDLNRLMETMSERTQAHERVAQLVPYRWTIKPLQARQWLLAFSILWLVPLAFGYCAVRVVRERLRLGGWQRLFVVLALVWGGAVFWETFDELHFALVDYHQLTPAIEARFTRYEKRALERMREYEYSPESFSSASDFDSVEAAIATVKEAKERVAPSEWRIEPVRLGEWLFLLLGLWLIPLIVIYYVLRLAVWVVRGFRTTRTG